MVANIIMEKCGLKCPIYFLNPSCCKKTISVKPKWAPLRKPCLRFPRFILLVPVVGLAGTIVIDMDDVTINLVVCLFNRSGIIKVFKHILIYHLI